MRALWPGGTTIRSSSCGVTPDPKLLQGIGVSFVRFAVVGTLATGIQYLILIALVHGAKAHPTGASSIGFVASSAVNYVLNYHYTFRSNRRHGPAAVKFALLAGVGLLLNAAIVQVLIGAGWHYMLAQVCATAVVLVWNFAGNSLWIFGLTHPR
jgi:putative flippase GtrA